MGSLKNVGCPFSNSRVSLAGLSYEMYMCWVVALPSSIVANEGSQGSPTKNVKVLVVAITGKAENPICNYMQRFVLSLCQRLGSLCPPISTVEA